MLTVGKTYKSINGAFTVKIIAKTDTANKLYENYDIYVVEILYEEHRRYYLIERSFAMWDALWEEYNPVNIWLELENRLALQI